MAIIIDRDASVSLGMTIVGGVKYPVPFRPILNDSE